MQINNQNFKHMIARLFAVCLLLTLSACNLPIVEASPANTPAAVSNDHNLVTMAPDPSSTTTPFQPLGPTSTPTITYTPTITSTPTATPITNTPTPTVWTDGLEKPEGQVNLMLLGNDYRPSSGYRTDVMMLISINTKAGTVKVLSFPRDLYVEIPGRGSNRLNVAYPFGGFELFADTMELNFGVRPDAFIMTNFQGFVSIVNTLGGINVNCSSYLYDTCDLPQAVGGYCSAGPGTVQMNGATALWYVRSRYTSNDFDRNRRQQEVMYAIFNKTVSLNALTRAPELYNTFRSSVETDMGVDDIVKLITMIPKLKDGENITRYAIGPAQTTSWWTPGGAAVLLPIEEAVHQVIIESVFTP